MLRDFSPEGLRIFLESVGVSVRFFRFAEHTMTVDNAAKRINVGRERIIKSLVFICDDGSPVLAIVSGDRRVDERKLAAVCGVRRVRWATASEVKDLTGYEVGAVPPVGHKNRMRTIVDEGVFRFDRVIGGGGEINTLMEISPEDIVRLNGAEIEDISK
ncbi:MAG: aminoacyl-tRNA deacylase [Candidatus Bathyarchaeia archaeon]